MSVTTTIIAEDKSKPTLTYDGRYHCAQCGTSQFVLCKHWQELFRMAHAAICMSGMLEAEAKETPSE